MKEHYDKLNRLSESHGALQPGKGMASGVIALMLAALCFLGVLAFHFPEYLTTPELRKAYSVDAMRQLLFWSLVLAGALALFNVVMSRARWLALAAFVLIGLSLALGGHKVPVNDFADNTPYIGLDWFILDLLGSTLIFVFIEKLFALRKDQPVFRPEWQTDFHHFLVNHMIVGFVLLATNLLVHKLFGWAAKDGIRAWVQDLPFFVALFLIVLVADLVQYWTHRAYHEVPALWRLHAVHHSVKSMDWLAGSRQHERARDDQLEDVLARAGQPVHALDAVVDGVQPPQHGDLVIGAMRPVLDQVGDQDDQEQGDEERQVLDPGADAVLGGPAEQLVDEQVGREQDEAHDHVVDEEVVEVGLPLRPEHRLVLPQRERLLDEDEDQRRAEQVEDEPVEADVGRVVGEVVDRNLVAAERQRQADQRERAEREPARPAP